MTSARLGRLRYAAALVSGPTEVLDFLLPLWAAAEIGGTPAGIGAVVAIEAAVSLAVRPVAGVLADRVDRRLVAAVGAAGYAVAFTLYAVASTMPVVGAGAALGGAGGALFWVALRTDVGAHLHQDRAAYAQLLSSEQAGSLVAFVIGLTLLGSIGYHWLFLLGAVACVLAGLLLVRRPSRPDDRAAGPGTGLRPMAGRLTPLLAVTALTAGAESAIGLLLLLHLQSEFGLPPQQIAVLFLPGAIVLVVLPGRAHRWAVRLGRTRSMVLSLLATGGFTAGLAVFDRPLLVGALWALSAATLAIALPVEQATVAEASAGGLGRGVSLYQASALLGTFLTAPVMAYAYGRWGWSPACVAAGIGLGAAAVAVPPTLRVLGLPDALEPAAEPAGSGAESGTGDADDQLAVTRTMNDQA